MKDHPIDPSILDAIEQGRGERGRRAPKAWSRHRAQLLTAAYQGLSLVRIAGNFGLSRPHLNSLLEEACAAVLQGGAASDAADEVCARRWQGWCETGDTEACERLRRR